MYMIHVKLFLCCEFLTNYCLFIVRAKQSEQHQFSFPLYLSVNFMLLSPSQEDVVMGTLTVRENLHFSAALRLPNSVPQSNKEARVNHLIKELGLTKVADTKVFAHMMCLTCPSH